MRKFEMPQEDTEKTSYANQEPEFENRSLAETTDGKSVQINSNLLRKANNGNSKKPPQLFALATNYF